MERERERERERGVEDEQKTIVIPSLPAALKWIGRKEEEEGEVGSRGVLLPGQVHLFPLPTDILLQAFPGMFKFNLLA